MCDEESLFRPRVQDAWIWQVAVGDQLHPSPRQPMLLTSSPNGAEPALDQVVTERGDRRRAHWHGVVGKPPAQHFGEPLALHLDAVITPNPLRSGRRSLIAPPLSTAFCCSVLPCRGHGSLRGRRWPPQHLVRSTGAAMSTTGSHGNQAAQRPPSQPSCTLAPVGNPSPRRRMTRVDLVRV